MARLDVSRFESDLWRSQHDRLVALAYRMHAVQEAFARWYALPVGQRAAIDNPPAWFTQVTSRICLDGLGSARRRRERYVGEWIPEPIPQSAQWASSSTSAEDPADRLTLDGSLTMAFLVVLERATASSRCSRLNSVPASSAASGPFALPRSYGCGSCRPDPYP